MGLVVKVILAAAKGLAASAALAAGASAPAAPAAPVASPFAPPHVPTPGPSPFAAASHAQVRNDPGLQMPSVSAGNLFSAPLSPPASSSSASLPITPPTPSVQLAGAKKIDDLFHQMMDMKASDMHLKSDKGPMLRVDGSMAAMPNRQPLPSPALFTLLEEIMPERNRAEFAETNDTDFAYELPDKVKPGVLRARMRCNVFRDIAGVGAVFRQIPSKILTAEDLKLPKACIDFCGFDKGLVVVTGPTGSGKSTTLAAMIDWINANRDDHIITIEDPVEFVHKDKKCLINQREVGTQTKSFKAALRAALREDPDIVLVGEMRDLETVAIAIETAETGHLVFGTLHTNTAPSTVDRLIDQFPTDRQAQIRIMLSESLKGVVAQTLLKKKGGGRVAALEILVVTHAVANLIREGKTFQIPSLMQTGRGIGMRTLNDALIDLVKNDVVEAEEAYDRAPEKKTFGALLNQLGAKGPWNDDKAPGAH
jgi:twitching motility protein PilT